MVTTIYIPFFKERKNSLNTLPLFLHFSLSTLEKQLHTKINPLRLNDNLYTNVS